MSEERAFDCLKYLMFRMGFRRQYKPDMVPLQVRLCQIRGIVNVERSPKCNYLATILKILWTLQ